MTDNSDQMTSTRPYLFRAFYDWIVDNNTTPYVVIDSEVPNVKVPQQYIEDGKIVLNISISATEDLKINNYGIEFNASFSGLVYHITAPMAAVLAIYAKENGRGMVFGEEDDDGGFPPPPADDGNDSGDSGDTGKSDKKPKLRVVK